MLQLFHFLWYLCDAFETGHDRFATLTFSPDFIKMHLNYILVKIPTQNFPHVSYAVLLCWVLVTYDRIVLALV